MVTYYINEIYFIILKNLNSISIYLNSLSILKILKSNRFDSFTSTWDYFYFLQSIPYTRNSSHSIEIIKM